VSRGLILESAVPALIGLVKSEAIEDVWRSAVFAIGRSGWYLGDAVLAFCEALLTGGRKGAIELPRCLVRSAPQHEVPFHPSSTDLPLIRSGR
jgi:hypothetical protein